MPSARRERSTARNVIKKLSGCKLKFLEVYKIQYCWFFLLSVYFPPPLWYLRLVECLYFVLIAYGFRFCLLLTTAIVQIDFFSLSLALVHFYILCGQSSRKRAKQTMQRVTKKNETEWKLVQSAEKFAFRICLKNCCEFNVYFRTELNHLNSVQANLIISRWHNELQMALQPSVCVCASVSALLAAI